MKLAIAIALGLGDYTQIHAQPATPVIFVQSSTLNQSRQSNQSSPPPPPPPDTGKPGRRTDTGGR
jgi:hypothetical protein